MADQKILLIEDDASLRNAIEIFLARLGYQVESFENAEDATQALDEDCHLILSDVMMPGLSGYDLLNFSRQRFPHTPFIIMTAYGTIEKAVEAMKNGAYDFLVKPFSLNVLETLIKAALLDRQAALDINEGGDGKAGSSFVSAERAAKRFITQDNKLKQIIENLKRIAPSKATVLVQGESGTGKELIARMIHDFSPRAKRIFVAINCAAMPDSLLESELFGHEKGSFTGASARHIGKFELSNNGTILLDEISEMSLTMQTKLLRVLQECEIYRVGGVKPIPLNLRVIATTNRNLYKYMKEGHFREDLFYRINVIPVSLPPLREREDDLLLLAESFLKEFSLLHAKKCLDIDVTAEKKITSHGWYGNIRELRNAMERAILVGDFSVIDEGAAQAPQAAAAANTTAMANIKPGMTLDEIEKEVILMTLEQFKGNRTKTAGQLGISLRTLRNKLRAYGVASEMKGTQAS